MGMRFAIGLLFGLSCASPVCAFSPTRIATLPQITVTDSSWNGQRNRPSGGSNVLTVIAREAAGNTATASLTVTSADDRFSEPGNRVA